MQPLQESRLIHHCFCAIPFVTPEVLLSPAIEGRFFIPSQIYWKKQVLHHYLDVFLQSYLLIAYSQ